MTLKTINYIYFKTVFLLICFFSILNHNDNTTLSKIEMLDAVLTTSAAQIQTNARQQEMETAGRHQSVQR